MAELPSYVVDATIVGKWFLHEAPGERYTTPALQLLNDFQEGRVRLVAPGHLLYEVPSILCKAIGGQRITQEKAQEAVEALLSYPLGLVTEENLLRNGCYLSPYYQCSFYDALYLVVAQAGGYPFIHADDRLRRTLRGRFHLELWIEDYHSRSS